MKRISPSKGHDLDSFRSSIVSQSLMTAALSSLPLHPDEGTLAGIEEEFEADASRKMQALLAKADFWRSQGMVDEHVVAKMGMSLGTNAGRSLVREAAEASVVQTRHSLMVQGAAQADSGGPDNERCQGEEGDQDRRSHGDGDVGDGGRTRSTRLKALLDYVDDSMRRSVQDLAWLRDRPPGELRAQREREVEALQAEIEGLRAENTALRLSRVGRTGVVTLEASTTALDGLSREVREGYTLNEDATEVRDVGEGEGQGEEEVAGLVRACLSGDPLGRLEAVEGLHGAVMRGEGVAMDAVVQRLLDDTNSSVRAASLVCLANAGARHVDGPGVFLRRVGERVGGDVMVMHFADCSWGVRRTAIELARRHHGAHGGERRGEGAEEVILLVRGLVKCMKDREWRVRLSACRATGDIAAHTRGPGWLRGGRRGDGWAHSLPRGPG